MKNKIKVSDLIIEFFESKGVSNIFLLSGGMMMHLLDSLSKSSKIKYICNHHEQASSFAAESFSRISGNIGVCFATSGPGSTNTITGITSAWVDSTPLMILTGQSRTSLTARGMGNNNIRMVGNFEVDIVEIIRPITKYAFFVDNPNAILYHLEKAYQLSKNGRPGPVLLDIPLDVQSAMINKDELLQVMDDLRSAEVDFLTIGQYLQPSVKHHPLEKYYHPDEFKDLENIAKSKGFLLVSSSPLTRSSYHADEDFAQLQKNRLEKYNAQSLS